MSKKGINFLWVSPVMFGFFIMGFVDMAGIATSYVKQDFSLNDTTSSLVPMLAFLWFLVFAVPTGILMGKIGRKNTALLSLLITILGLALPLIAYNFPIVLLAFALLGIGNTVSQISFNPLLTNVISNEKLTSALTFGQFTRSVASFLGPVIAGVVASYFNDWKLIFWVYALVSLLSFAWLYFTALPKEAKEEKPISWSSAFSLFRDKYILACFFGILFFVGIDVGLNTYIPKFLMERTGLPLERAGIGTSLYFAARMLGSLVGTFLLLRMAALKFLRWSLVVLGIVFALLLSVKGVWMLGILIFLLGLMCANIFSIILSLALHHRPERANEVSALVLMGVAGGAISTPLMGLVADYAGQSAGLAVLWVCVLYLLIFSYLLKN